MKWRDFKIKKRETPDITATSRCLYMFLFFFLWLPTLVLFVFNWFSSLLCDEVW